MDFNMICKVSLFVLLFVAFLCLSLYLKKSQVIKKSIKLAYTSLDNASLAREKNNIENIHKVGRKKSLFERINTKLVYSGIPRMVPFITAEIWTLMLVLSGFVFYLVAFFFSKRFMLSLAIGAGVVVFLLMVEYLLSVKNYNAVDKDLMEFLNLLGNYSITSTEITGVFYLISRYLSNPLRTVLEECYYEAQTTGDTSGALINLAEKIEHPKFKEIINNVEISSRYSGNFSSIVKNSRRLIQDYNKNKKERKSIVKEGLINMLILGAMFVWMLYIVCDLVGITPQSMLFGTLVGKICLAIILAIYVAFAFKAISINRD